MTRSFSPEPLTTELLVELLDLARRAPSAGYSQGTHFLLLEGEQVPWFWEVTGAGPWFDKASPGVTDAPTIVIPLADAGAYMARYAEPDKATPVLEGEPGPALSREDAWPVPYWQTDTAMAVQNLLLLAEDRGLGALFFGLFGGEDELLAELGVPSGVRPIGAVALGHRAGDDRPSGSATTRPRRHRAAVVHLGRWSDPASD
jgi:nitroreductase